MLEGAGASSRVGLKLLLDTVVVRVLEPGAQQDGVVLVAHGAQQGSGGTGKVVGQGKLSHQLPQESIETPWERQK